MKALFATLVLMAAAVSYSQSAQALVQLDGTFVPTKCGVQTQANVIGPTIHAVCVGNIVGDNAPAVQFRGDGVNETFKVDKSADLLIALLSGNTKTILYLVDTQGATATMSVIKTADGEITAASGTLGPMKFKVPEFQHMLTIQ